MDEKHRWRHWLVLLLILLATFLAYARALWNDYTYDDRVFVMVPNSEGAPNPMVADVQALPSYFASHYGHGVTDYGRGFRPITVLSFALVNKMFGPAPEPKQAAWDYPPWPQHLVNILLHLLSVLLTYRMVALFTGGGAPALIGAAVFGLHALRSDPVISMVGRAEILGYVFGAGAVLCYVGGLQRAGLGRILWLSFAWALLYLSCCSKENAMAWAVFVPLFVLTLDCHRNPERSIGAGLRRQLPALVAVVMPLGAALAHWYFLQQGLTHQLEIKPLQNPIYHEEGLARWLTPVMLLGYGLYKVLLPLHLASDYGAAVFEMVRSIFDWRLWLAVAALLVVLIGGLRCFRRQPLLFLGMASFLGFSFITSNILVRVETIFAERIYYAPAVGLSFLIAWTTQRVARETRVWVVVAVTAWCAVGGLLIFQRCVDWQDNDSLFLADAERQPRSLAMRLNAARYYQEKGDAEGWKGDSRQKVLEHLVAANRADPKDAVALIRLAGYFISFGELDEAERRIKEARASKKYVEKQDGPDAHRLLAIIAEQRGDVELAAQHLEKAIKIWPDMAAPYIEHALFLLRINRREDAEARLREVVKDFPDCEPAWMSLVDLVRRRKDQTEVRRLLEQGLRSNQRSAWMALQLGLLHHEAQRFPEAVEQLERAYSGRLVAPDKKRCRIPLAESLVAVDRKAEALSILEEVLSEPRLAKQRQERVRKLIRELGGN